MPVWLIAALAPVIGIGGYVATEEAKAIGTSYLTTTTADSQIAGAAAQIENARAGKPLASIAAEGHDPVWFEPPTNRIGAYARAAYWCATAARLRKQPVLTGYAQEYLNAAQVENTGQNTVGNPLTTEQGDVRRILYDAQRKVAAAGAAEVAAQLDALRRYQPPTQGGIEALFGSPAARTRAIAIAAAATVVALFVVRRQRVNR